jgi:hypothetical protein
MRPDTRTNDNKTRTAFQPSPRSQPSTKATFRQSAISIQPMDNQGTCRIPIHFFDGDGVRLMGVGFVRGATMNPMLRSSGVTDSHGSRRLCGRHSRERGRKQATLEDLVFLLKRFYSMNCEGYLSGEFRLLETFFSPLLASCTNLHTSLESVTRLGVHSPQVSLQK